MALQDLSSIRVAWKNQAAFDTPASGAGATGLEVRQSSGLALAVAQIESQLIRTNRMRRRPRHGSRSTTGSYETEIMVGAQDGIWCNILGSAATLTAELAFSNTDWGAVAITGTGVTATFASGTLVTDGIRAGMMIRFTNLSVAGNNAKWIPIVSVTETVMTLATGYIIDNASDAAYTVEIASHTYTPATYLKRYVTVEEYWTDLTKAKVGTDQVFNELTISVSPDSPATIAFGLGGRDLGPEAAAVFTSPVFSSSSMLVLIDGGLYVDGIKRLDPTSLTLGLSAPVSTIPMIASNLSPGVSLGQFALTGSITGTLEDGDILSDFTDETQMSMHLHFKHPNNESFISVYAGNLIYGSHSSPSGGEGGATQTMALWGGADDRGTGYADTSLLFSTSVD